MTDAIWTSNPPSEAGWYWIVYNLNTSYPFAELFFRADEGEGEWLYGDSGKGNAWGVSAANGWQRSTAPIESAESLTSLRARVRAAEGLAEAMRPLLARGEPISGEHIETADRALAAWEAAK